MADQTNLQKVTDLFNNTTQTPNNITDQQQLSNIQQQMMKQDSAPQIQPDLQTQGQATQRTTQALQPQSQGFVPHSGAKGIFGDIPFLDKIEDAIQKNSTAKNLGQKAEAFGSNYARGLVPFFGAAENALMTPEQRTTREQDVAQNQGIANIGTGAGILSSMAVPFPGASELGILKGAKGFLPSVARGVISGGMASVPYAAGNALETGDVKGSMVQALEGLGLGAAAGGAGHVINQIPQVQRALGKMQIRAGGITTADLKGTLLNRARQMGMNASETRGYVNNNIDKLINDSADKIGSYGYTDRAKEALRQDISKGFEQHAKLFDDATGKVISNDSVQSVSQSPILKDALKRFGQQVVNEEILKQGIEIDGLGWTKARENLNDYSMAGKRVVDPRDPIKLREDVADAWKAHLDDTADKLAGQARANGANIANLHDLKSTYPAALALKASEAREAMRIKQPAVGSGTPAGSALLQKYGPAAATTIMGLGAGAGMNLKDMLDNPEDTGLDLAKIAGAGLVGMGLTRAAGAAYRQASGRTAGLLRNPEALAQVAGRIPTAFQQIRNATVSQPQTTQAQSATPVAPATQQAQTTPVAPATQPSIEDYANESLKNYYNNMPDVQKNMSFNEFSGLMKERSQNFTPENENTAKALYPGQPEEQANFKKSVMASKRMNIQDILTAVDNSGAFSGKGLNALFGDKNQVIKNEVTENVISQLKSLAPQGTNVKKRLAEINYQYSDPQEILNAIYDYAKEWGIDLKLMQNIGVLR
jgi:hypothetical protein